MPVLCSGSTMQSGVVAMLLDLVIESILYYFFNFKWIQKIQCYVFKCKLNFELFFGNFEFGSVYFAVSGKIAFRTILP